MASPAKAAPKVQSGWATVAEVRSGDSVRLQASTQQIDQPSVSKLLSLSGILAPRIALGQRGTDEPFGFQAREFLRKLLIGKHVQFWSTPPAEAGRREYGRLVFEGKSVAEHVVGAGWAAVKLSKNQQDRRAKQAAQAAAQDAAGGNDDAESADGAPSALHENEILLQLQDEAKAKKIGMWQEGVPLTRTVRTVDWLGKKGDSNRAASQKLADKCKGMAADEGLPAIVDQVRDGTTFRLEVLSNGPELRHKGITLFLSGVQSPRVPLPQSVLDQQYRRDKERYEEMQRDVPEHVYEDDEPPKLKKAANPPPHALTAQRFSATRLLQRDVKVHIESVDKRGNFWGYLVFPKGDIAVSLLSNGLCTYIPWSAAQTSAERRKALQEAELVAKRDGLRLYAANANKRKTVAGTSLQPGSESHGKIVQVMSGDSFIFVDGEGQEIRLHLASIRTPIGGGGRSSRKPEAYAQDAKEFFRSSVIGRRVKVVIEYSREGRPDHPTDTTRIFASVHNGKLWVSVGLVAKGFAEVLRHGPDDPRSFQYQELLDAEVDARKAKRGIFGKATSAINDPVDLTQSGGPRRRHKGAAAAAAGDDEEDTHDEEAAATSRRLMTHKCRTYLETFKKERRLAAVVEHVFSGGRLKLFVPKHNCFIAFIFSGLRCARVPREPEKQAAGRKDPSTDDWATAASDWMKEKVLQHDVVVDIEAMDNGNNFIGSLSKGQHNVGLALLGEGFATVFGPSADRSPLRDELYAAEEQAQGRRLRRWKDYDAAAEAAKKAEAAKAAMSSAAPTEDAEVDDTLHVLVTDVTDAVTFYAQDLNGSVDATDIEKQVAALTLDAVPGPTGSEDWVSRGTVVAGHFEGSWYRCRLETRAPVAQDASPEWQVYYMDYGNRDVLSVAQIRQLPQSLQKLPAAAMQCELAAIQAPIGSSGEFEAAAVTTSEAVLNQRAYVRVFCKDRANVLHVELLREAGDAIEDSVNALLLKRGQARVQRRPNRVLEKSKRPRVKDYMAFIKACEKQAHRSHVGMWKFGDPGDEEDAELAR